MLALSLVASSCACCALVVASPIVLLLATTVVRAAAETSSGRLTIAAGEYLGLVAAALDLGGEGFSSRRSLLLVQVAAGVEVSVAVALGQCLGLRAAAYVDCGCHCSLFDGRLSALLWHWVTDDAQVGLLSLSLGWLLASSVGKCDRGRAGCSSRRRARRCRRHLLTISRWNTTQRLVLNIVGVGVRPRLVDQLSDQVWLRKRRRPTHVVCLHGQDLLQLLEATRTLCKL